MEVREGADLRHGVWHYRPELAPMRAVTLTRSGFTTDYELCQRERCIALTALVGPPREDGATMLMYACS